MHAVRLRRLRKNKLLRDWVSQTRLRSEDLIFPYFVVNGKRIKKPVVSMPGVAHLSIDNLLSDIDKVVRLGIKSILLFGLPQSKDRRASSSYKNNGIVQRAVRAIKRSFKGMIVITDVCLCGYTSHGHCGIINGGRIDNDTTLKVLSKIALSHAEAGADFVAPSAMMDAQVAAIRKTLDKSGLKDTGILSYSAKYASNFYGPFRDALDSSPQFGDRKDYQMDFRNSDEALREIEQDIIEGADIVMVKPALSYMDIIYRAKERFNIPIAAYNVSGEYSMVKEYAGKASGVGSRKLERDIVLEILTGIKRAGADFIITYYAKDVAEWLRA